MTIDELKLIQKFCRIMEQRCWNDPLFMAKDDSLRKLCQALMDSYSMAATIMTNKYVDEVESTINSIMKDVEKIMKDNSERIE